MSYERWLEILEEIKNSSNEQLKEELLKEEVNENLRDMLEGKIVNLIKDKFKYTVKKLMGELNHTFSDVNNLDLYLINLKKDLKYIYDLTYIKEIREENQELLRKTLKNEIDEIYNILIKEANNIDKTGSYYLTIKNNKLEV